MDSKSRPWNRRSLDDAPVLEQDEEEANRVEGDEVRRRETEQARPGSQSAHSDSPSRSESETEPSNVERSDPTGSTSDPIGSGSATAIRRARFQSSEASNGMASPSIPDQLKGSSPAPSSPPMTSSSPRVPAAGLGTRVRPRPVPKSHSSLRHISSKSRSVTFGAPMPEDRDPSQPSVPFDDGRSSAQKSVEAAQRREQEQLQREAFLDSDPENDDDLLGLGESTALTTSSESAEYEHKKKDSAKPGPVSFIEKFALTSSDEEEDYALPRPDINVVSHDEVEAGPSKGLIAQSQQQRRRAEMRQGVLDEDSPPSTSHSAYGGLQTPGPRFPHQLHTPVDTPPEFELESFITPQERLEWHTMLQSTLRSEVLKSETKRITLADAPSLTRDQLMYRRWLDIRASLRGRGHQKGAVDIEEKRLNEGWPVMIKDVIQAIQDCRIGHSGREISDGEDDDHMTASVSEEEKESVYKEVESVLEKVDRAEEQFPSFRKMAEKVPEWMDEALQKKLQALYSWYNVLSSLKLQIKILQEWTGSETLDVQNRDGKGKTSADERLNETHGFHAGLEEGTFLERILKENSLQSTFEKRTLRTLSRLITKARDAITKHHGAFSDMALPSFETELVQLIKFPTRLMEAALRVRLDYVGKLTDPSVLIVDSLIDDLRAAIALACRIKLQYTTMTSPQPEVGWDLPSCISSDYDVVLREALTYFFKLLNYKLKGSLFFKETEILEPEWRFLSTAVEVIEGADVLVAQSITRIVNKLFLRIVRYFDRELAAPSTRRSTGGQPDRPGQLINQITAANSAQPRGPSVAGGLTKGHVKMTLEEKARWIHQVFDSVRIRSRKLLYFSRDIRNRLENAAEFDLSTLCSPNESNNGTGAGATQNADEGDRAIPSDSDAPRTGLQASPRFPVASRARPGNSRMSLTDFLQTLIDAGYFLVLTGTFEAEGVYLIAEPSLHDKPEVVQELFTKCMRRMRPQEDPMPSAAHQTRKEMFNASGVLLTEESGKDEESDAGMRGGSRKAAGKDEAPIGLGVEESGEPKYLLILTPRDAFMWTGKVMYLQMDRVDISLKDRRLRLVADGPQKRLELCKKHLYNVFGADYASVSAHLEDEDNAEDGFLQRQRRRPSVVRNGQPFPLDIVDESLAHMRSVQLELRRINKGVYMLSDAVIQAVPKIRRKLRGRRGDRVS